MNNTIVKHPLALHRSKSLIVIVLLNGASPPKLNQGKNARSKKLWLRNFDKHIVIAAITGTQIHTACRRNANVTYAAIAVFKQSLLAGYA